MADDRQSARSRPSASSGFAELDDPDRTWIPTFRLKSLELASPAPKFSSPAARLGGLRLGDGAPQPGIGYP